MRAVAGPIAVADAVALVGAGFMLYDQEGGISDRGPRRQGPIIPIFHAPLHRWPVRACQTRWKKIQAGLSVIATCAQFLQEGLMRNERPD